MKKITILLFAFFAFLQVNAQVSVNEGFESATTPTGWVYTSFSRSTITPCVATASLRRNFWSSGLTGSVTTPNFPAASNGQQIDVSFDWKSTEYSVGSLVGVSMDIQYSTDNGTVWTNLGNITTTSITSCATWTASIPAGTVVAGADFKLRFNGTRTAGDCYFYIDKVIIFQPSTTPPNCTVLSAPANGAVNVSSSIISWPTATGAPTGYKLKVGTTPGGTDILNLFDVANVLTYNLGALTAGTTYYVTVVPYNANGDAVGPCSESSFTTCSATSVLPWTENFDGLASVGTTFFPGCWTKENGDWASSNATTYNSPKSGANYLRNAYTATNEYMWTTGFNLVAGTSYDFSTFVQGDNGTSWVVDMFYNNSASSVGATQLGASYNVPGTGSPYAPQAYVEMRRTFVPSVTATYYFAVRVNEPSGAPWYVAFDDFRLELTPSCTAPTGLLANNVTTVSADMVWNAVGGSVNYEYVLDQLAADPIGAGTSTMATSFNATLLTASTTYYFHIRNNCGGSLSAWTTTSFTTPAAPPVNNNCSAATVLTIGGVFADNVTAGTILAATTTAGVTPSCQASFSSDVWYSVVVPASGSLTVETQGAATNSMTDSVIAVFSGTCGALTQVGCDDDLGVGNMSLLSVTGQTPGATLYVGVWKYATAAPTASNSQFKISVYDASLGNDSFDNAGFSYYPNPVKNVLNLSYTQNISNVSVYNLLGQQVIAKVINANQSQVDMSNLSRGTYMVKVTSDNQVKTIKVIKE